MWVACCVLHVRDNYIYLSNMRMELRIKGSSINYYRYLLQTGSILGNLEFGVKSETG